MEGRGLGSRRASAGVRDLEIGMGLTPPPTVQKLQATLRAKAKGRPNYRFYALYDKVCRTDVLAHAYELCRANRGAAGVDGATFEDIEASGREAWLGGLARPSVSSRGRARADAASPVAAPEEPKRRPGDDTLPRRVPVRRPGTHPPQCPDEQPPVGEGLTPRPRAGCGKSARPVR